MGLGLERQATEKRVLWPKVQGESLRAAGRNVVIAYDEAETETAGGIIIPTTVEQKSQMGTVLSTGPRCRLGIEIGDRVVFCNVWGQDVLHNGKRVRIVTEDHIEAVL